MPKDSETTMEETHMTRVRLMLLASLAAAAVLCAPALASAHAKTVGGKRNGKTVTIKPGAKLRIVLTGPFASTGSHWSLAKKPSHRVLRVLVDGKIKSAGQCAPGETGCPQKDVFVFRASNRIVDATTKLKLVLLPPGRNAKPVETYTLKVHVYIKLPLECQSEAHKAC